jgi:hypothetical protein
LLIVVVVVVVAVVSSREVAEPDPAGAVDGVLVGLDLFGPQVPPRHSLRHGHCEGDRRAAP